jgi:hypothetical protein
LQDNLGGVSPWQWHIPSNVFVAFLFQPILKDN